MYDCIGIFNLVIILIRNRRLNVRFTGINKKNYNDLKGVVQH